MKTYINIYIYIWRFAECPLPNSGLPPSFCHLLPGRKCPPSAGGGLSTFCRDILPELCEMQYLINDPGDQKLRKQANRQQDNSNSFSLSLKTASRCVFCSLVSSRNM